MASPTAARTAARAWAASRGAKNMIVSASKRSVSPSLRGSGNRPLQGPTLEALEDLRERRALGERPPQHLDHLLDGLGHRVGVSGRPALADEKADVPDDAVADLAESREMDEQPLLEQATAAGCPGRPTSQTSRVPPTSPGAASAEQKKLGRTPKRSVTSRLKRSVRVCSCADSLIT